MFLVGEVAAHGGGCKEKRRVCMKRKLWLLLVALAVAAILLVMVVPAFADPGEFGRTTQTGECLDPGNLNCTHTTAGKEGNALGGPGRNDYTITTNSVPLPTDEEILSLEGASSGGGGRCEFDASVFGNRTQTFSEEGRGQNAPCPFSAPLP